MMPTAKNFGFKAMLVMLALPFTMAIFSANPQKARGENVKSNNHSHHGDVCITGEHLKPMGMDVQPITGTDTAPAGFNRAGEAQTAAYDKFFKDNQERHLKDLADLVAFPSLRMDPKHAADVQKPPNS